MSSNSNDERDVPESSNRRRRHSESPPHRAYKRHAPQQIQMLEEYFKECQHPTEMDRDRIAMEIGLTTNQVKFWFQNKRTILKGKSEKEEGYMLREEYDILKVECLSLKHLANEYKCNACKVLTPGAIPVNHTNMRQLQADNTQLRQKYYNTYESLKGRGIQVSIDQDLLPRGVVSSINQSIEASQGQSSMEPTNPIVADDNSIVVNANVNPNPNPNMDPPIDSEIFNMMQTIGMARDELMSLLCVNEPFWLKDDGKYIIHREAYDATFTKTSARENRHQNGKRTRFESSKNNAILSMSGLRVMELLMDSKMRVEHLFPTIITEGFTIKEYENKCSSRQVGPIKLVYEQMHILAPFVSTRDFYFVRSCENVTKGIWLIVEVSHDFNDTNFQENYPSNVWRLPSGCIIKDVSPGISHVTWVEHVEIEDKAEVHVLYKDVFFRGLAFNADRWVEILSRSCHKITCNDNIVKNQLDNTIQNMGVLVGMTEEERKCLMNITDKMMKRFCSNMNMEDKLGMLVMKDYEICISLCRGQEKSNPANGLIVNVATSFWLDAPCEMIIEFLNNVNLRSQWDIVCDGNVEEVACLRFGDNLDNSISIIKPHKEHGNNLLVIQETLVDPLGAVIIYAPIDHEDFIGELYRSWTKAVLASGFIVSKDGKPEHMGKDFGGASTSRNVAPSSSNGSLVTLAFQVVSYSKDIEMEFMNIVSSIISSTADRIKLVFDFYNPSK